MPHSGLVRRRFAFAVLLMALDGASGIRLAASAPVPVNAPWGTTRPTPRSLPLASRELVIVADEGVLELAQDGAPRAADSRLAGELARQGLVHARPIGPDPRPGSRARRERIWALSSRDPAFDPVAAARALQATGAVRAASPNYRFALLATLPNDPYLSNQWYVDDGGYADIRLPFAWDLERGDTSVVIAILDTGIDTMHPDLASRIWNNPGEIAANGLDDDGNGFIDDTEGWDFGSGDANPNPEYTSDPSGIDVGFHGTFCAGIAAAATDNGVGIAGAGWECRLMPLKVSHPDSGITSVAIAGAFAYAVDEGASVISMSFGGPGEPGVPEFFQGLVDLATGAGALCVAAAGNDGDSTRVYPAACEDVLAVGATDFGNARASFSNWGPWVDVAAPGSLMFSTICRNYTLTDLDQIFYIYFFGWDGENPYMFGDGTSFACPLAAGVCGLVRSRFPALPPRIAAQHVIATGDLVSHDRPIGPRVNAFAAVSAGPVAVEPGSLTDEAPAVAFAGVAPNPIAGSTEITFRLAREARIRLALYDASGRLVRTLAEGFRTAGRHSVRWDGGMDRGGRAAAGVYFARLESRGAALQTKLVLLGP